MIIKKLIVVIMMACLISTSFANAKAPAKKTKKLVCKPRNMVLASGKVYKGTDCFYIYK